MQFASEYPYNISYDDVKIKCKEVEFPGKKYSKLVTSDGLVAILYSPGQGGGWSTFTIKDESKHQLIFDSRMVMYVLSSDFKSTFIGKHMTSETDSYYRQFMKYVFPSKLIPSIDAFSQLKVHFIPENSMFRINGQKDGDEQVFIIDDPLYFIS